MNSEKTILFFTNSTCDLEMLTRFAKQHNYRLRRADDIVDVFACSPTVAVIQRDLLEESLFSYLKEVYIDEVPLELKYMEDELQWEFEETFIVFGEGPEIPDAFKYFFIEVQCIDEKALSNAINNSVKKTMPI